MLCAYPTVKYVQIQDARLVVLRYSLLLVIALYVGVFEMWAMGGWLDPAPVVGVVRFSLQQPTVDSCDPSSPTCENAFLPLNELPYCQQSYSNNNNSNLYPGQVYPCEIYEAINAQIIHENSMTVITRASSMDQTLTCTAKNLTCPRTYRNSSPETKFYTAQSEAFTIMLDHAVTSSKICTRHLSSTNSNASNSNRQSYACSAEAAAYQGRLYSKNQQLCELEHGRKNAFLDYRGNIQVNSVPCYVGPNRTSTKQDFFSLAVLLRAAGVNLDDCNDIEALERNNDIGCETYRDTGATLILNIYWNDFVPYKGLVEPHYYYSPQLVARSAYKEFVPFYNNHYRQSRTLLNAHGIRLAVLLSGEFNQFNILTFMVTLTTALGLLAVATTIVDGLMLYILPEKERYQEAKYENTEEFDSAGARVVTSAVAGLTQLLQVPGVVPTGPRDMVSRTLTNALTMDERLGGGSIDNPQVSTEQEGLTQPLLSANGRQSSDGTT